MPCGAIEAARQQEGAALASVGGGAPPEASRPHSRWEISQVRLMHPGNNYKSGDVKIPYVAPEKVETKPVETETEIDPF